MRAAQYFTDLLTVNLSGIVETALYTDDLIAMQDFYENKLRLNLIAGTKGKLLFFKIGRTMLIIFDRTYTVDQTIEVNGNLIPSHATEGRGHLAFEAPAGEYQKRKTDIMNQGIEIESEITWSSGKKSFYFRDPSQHSIEIVEHGFWERE